MPARGPIFLAGIDRSGIGLLCELLEAHPNISMTRRTNFWTFYLDRFGNLSQPNNFERCLTEMMSFRRMQLFEPDPDRLRREFELGEKSYTRLFEILQQHRAERLGKSRWGDKSLGAEGHADMIFAAYPGATMVQIIRDPRDRCASLITHRGTPRSEAVSVGTAHWLSSVRLAERNSRCYPGRYKLMRYESLVSDPHGTLREVCHFVGEGYSGEIRSADGSDEMAGATQPSGTAPVHRREIRTTSVGRYREVLSPREIAFIQLFATNKMEEYGYDPVQVRLPFSARLLFHLWDLPHNCLRVGCSILKRRFATIAGRRRDPSARKISRTKWKPRSRTAAEGMS